MLDVAGKDIVDEWMYYGVFVGCRTGVRGIMWARFLC